MKKKTNSAFILCIAIIQIVFLSCSAKKDSIPPYYYNLRLEFVDQSGNDRTEGIAHQPTEIYEKDTYEIAGGNYTATVISTGKMGEELTLSPLFIQKATQDNRVLIVTNTRPEVLYRPTKLTHKISFPTIFSDDKEHIIVSNWKKVNDSFLQCTSIEVDGKNYQVAKNDEQGNPIFKISIN